MLELVYQMKMILFQNSQYYIIYTKRIFAYKIDLSKAELHSFSKVYYWGIKNKSQFHVFYQFEGDFKLIIAICFLSAISFEIFGIIFKTFLFWKNKYILSLQGNIVAFFKHVVLLGPSQRGPCTLPQASLYILLGLLGQVNC